MLQCVFVLALFAVHVYAQIESPPSLPQPDDAGGVSDGNCGWKSTAKSPFDFHFKLNNTGLGNTDMSYVERPGGLHFGFTLNTCGSLVQDVSLKGYSGVCPAGSTAACYSTSDFNATGPIGIGGDKPFEPIEYFVVSQSELVVLYRAGECSIGSQPWQKGDTAKWSTFFIFQCEAHTSKPAFEGEVHSGHSVCPGSESDYCTRCLRVVLPPAYCNGFPKQSSPSPSPNQSPNQSPDQSPNQSPGNNNNNNNNNDNGNDNGNDNQGGCGPDCVIVVVAAVVVAALAVAIGVFYYRRRRKAVMHLMEHGDIKSSQTAYQTVEG